MSEQSHCPECGAGLDLDVSGGHCPRSLMGVVMSPRIPTVPMEPAVESVQQLLEDLSRTFLNQNPRLTVAEAVFTFHRSK
jgi:hypothetical protein